VNLAGKKLRIVLMGDLTLGPDGLKLSPPRFVLLDEDGTEIATGPSARTLSRRALDAGAKECRFDFDLSHET
jgi:hypothetical protein